MSVHTEVSIRSELRNKKLEKYYVEPGDIITPSARAFLKEKGIELIVGHKEDKADKIVLAQAQKEEVLTKKYICSYTGAYFDIKPEHMTHIYGNKLVFKNDPRIIFRGKIDTFQSKLLKVQLLAKKNNQKKLLGALDEVLAYTRNILKCEVLEEKLEEINLLGWNEAQLRERSHNPKKYYGTGHVLVNADMDEMVIELNELRSESREVELAALNAFLSNGALQRADIIQALNRLSSTLYIMMLQVIAKEY